MRSLLACLALAALAMLAHGTPQCYVAYQTNYANFTRGPNYVMPFLLSNTTKPGAAFPTGISSPWLNFINSTTIAQVAPEYYRSFSMSTATLFDVTTRKQGPTIQLHDGEYDGETIHDGLFLTADNAGNVYWIARNNQQHSTTHEVNYAAALRWSAATGETTEVAVMHPPHNCTYLTFANSDSLRFYSINWRGETFVASFDIDGNLVSNVTDFGFLPLVDGSGNCFASVLDQTTGASQFMCYTNFGHSSGNLLELIVFEVDSIGTTPVSTLKKVFSLPNVFFQSAVNDGNQWYVAVSEGFWASTFSVMTISNDFSTVETYGPFTLPTEGELQANTVVGSVSCSA